MERNKLEQYLNDYVLKYICVIFVVLLSIYSINIHNNMNSIIEEYSYNNSEKKLQEKELITAKKYIDILENSISSIVGNKESLTIFHNIQYKENTDAYTVSNKVYDVMTNQKYTKVEAIKNSKFNEYQIKENIVYPTIVIAKEDYPFLVIQLNNSIDKEVVDKMLNLIERYVFKKWM